MKKQKFDSVWVALADSPEEAANLTMRSSLMSSIEKVVDSWDVTQETAAKRLGVSRPRLNDLLRGKLSKFSLDTLAMLAMRAGLKVEMSVKKAGAKRVA